MNPCKRNEPSVIDGELLERCIAESGPKGEGARLAKSEGIPLDEVEKLRMDYLKILRIDHLWMLTGLTKLSLSQNFIEKIENLDTLVNLKELDLSFNKIAKIENLDNLVKLECLTLFNNNIEKLENMDTLVNLVIFSIGNNLITNIDEILYLRKFEKLKSFNLAGNPCANFNDFRIFVAAFLPNLVYYEYKTISDKEKMLGQEKYEKKILYLEQDEREISEIVRKEKQAILDAELHSLSFVEYLGGTELFDSLFVGDPDGFLLTTLDEMKEPFTEFKNQFVAITKQLFDFGQEQYKVRCDEIEIFQKCVVDAKKKIQEDSIEHMEDFLEKKANLFNDINILNNQLQTEQIGLIDYHEIIDMHSNEFAILCHATWKKLMSLEMNLFESLEEANETFKHALNALVNSFAENSQGYFSQLRMIESEYFQALNEITSALATRKEAEHLVFQSDLDRIFDDKEILLNALGFAHELYLQIIDNREDVLVSRAKQWCEDFIEKLKIDTITENREKVLEINHFLDIQKEEFDDITEDTFGLTNI